MRDHAIIGVGPNVTVQAVPSSEICSEKILRETSENSLGESDCVDRKALSSNGIWGRVCESETGCWEWQEGLSNGYPNATIDGKGWRVARLMFAIFYGPLKNGECALHKCDNPACIRPDHLFAGTYSENNLDAVKKGRWVQGHPRWPRIVLNAVLARTIREEYATGTITQRGLSEKYGINPKTLCSLIIGQSWKKAGGPLGCPSRQGGRDAR